MNLPARRLPQLLLPIAIALACAAASAQAPRGGGADALSESVQRIALARGGELPVLVSKRPGTTPTIAILLFPGHPGILKLREEAGVPAFELGGNFVMRPRRFLNTARTFTVAVDCPVDQHDRCADDYRTSAQHVADIADVVAAVKATHGAEQVYLLATSYGTVSSAHLARGLAGKVDGAVHTASFTDPRGPRAIGAPMAAFDWTKATVPQLFVHHKDDPCELTRYASVVARKGDAPLITVEGVGSPHGDACHAFTAHGFVGREAATMRAILAWITDRKVTPVVGGGS